MKNYLASLLIAIGVVSVALVTYHFLSKDKIGYVRIGVVLQKYQAMVDANKQFASELSIVRNNVDTLRNRFEQLRAHGTNIKPAAKADWGYQVGVAEKEYMQYSEAADKQLQQRQQQLTADVLSKVNSYIEGYGKDNGYRYILGTTNEGSILFGRESDDLTETILSNLNASYSSKEPDKKN